MKKLWKPALLLAAIAVMVIGLLGSGAWFTDTATRTTVSLRSGVLSIEDNALATVSLGTIPNMAPGDVTPPVEIVIRNDGTVPLFWVGDLLVDGDLALKPVIDIDYALMQFEGGGWDEADDNFITAGRGSGLYPSEYNLTADMSPYLVNTLDVFDGHNYMGVPSYEFMGALKPGYAYRLTLKFGMVGGAGDEYQNKGPMNIKFKVLATQPKAAAIHAIGPDWDSNYLEGWALGQMNNQD